jgi:outer membrane protein OmpA-like peptidoglycan-associated protein
MARAIVPPRRRLYRRSNPGERWWFALLLMPALLTALWVYTRGDAIEAQLQGDVQASLEAEGLTGTSVEMNGRSALVRVPTGVSQAVVEEAAASVDGVADVRVEHVVRNAAEARACDDLQTKIENAYRNGGIRFAGSTTVVSGSAAVAVEAVANLLVRCPAASVTVEGHTDGSVLNAAIVSLRRAEAVRDVLVREGVQAYRIRPNGYGDSFPLTDADTAAGRAANNRVTITLAEG